MPPRWFTALAVEGNYQPMNDEIAKRLAWSGLMAATGALATWLAHRASAAIWRQVFDEEPPE